MKPNPAIAIPSIMRSHDKAWLTGFRARILHAGVPEVVAAIDKLLGELRESSLRTAIVKPLGTLTLIERVEEAVRVCEEFLAHRHHGRRTPASRTRAMIKRWGHKEAVRRTVTNMNMSSGLELLVKYDRLDYEQIIFDFLDEFDAGLAAKARGNLARSIAPNKGK
jgi:hypothetical protein